MKKNFVRILGMGVAGVAIGIGILHTNENAQAADQGVSIYRLYNRNTGEHFYTKESSERQSLALAGWKYEGIGWTAPTAGDAVYRLFNANASDHHYTTNQAEKDSLVTKGWKYEGICWYSDPGKAAPIYRAYNPNAKAGSHNYTVNLAEQNSLVKAGWKNEDIGWYGLNVPNQEEQTPTQPTNQADAIREAVVAGVNQLRAQSGRASLATGDATWQKLADTRANELVTLKGTQHTRPDGRSWSTILTEFNLKGTYSAASENLAYITLTDASSADLAQKIVKVFKESQKHNEAMINAEYKYINVGIVVDNASQRVYCTQIFMSPLN